MYLNVHLDTIENIEQNGLFFHQEKYCLNINFTQSYKGYMY